VFPFSPEEGTVAIGLPDQVDAEVRLKRAQLLRDAADEIGWERAAARISQTVDVLIEDFDAEEGVWLGRAPFQAPDIDGVVRIAADTDADTDANDEAALRPGAIIRVRLQDSLLYDLEGVTHYETA